MTFIGFHLSSKPADEEHPFGHERYEYLNNINDEIERYKREKYNG